MDTVKIKKGEKNMPIDLGEEKGNAAEQEKEGKHVKGGISGMIAMVLTYAYAVYIVSYFCVETMSFFDDTLASTLVMPHIVCVLVAAVFSLVGFCEKKRWAFLVAGILMAVSAALFPTYAAMVIVLAVLFFVSYARMKN